MPVVGSCPLWRIGPGCNPPCVFGAAGRPNRERQWPQRCPLYSRQKARGLKRFRVGAPVRSRTAGREDVTLGMAVHHGLDQSANQGDGTGLGDGLAVGVHEVHLPDVRSGSASFPLVVVPSHPSVVLSVKANTFSPHREKTSNRFISTLFHTGTKTSLPSLLGVKHSAQTTKDPRQIDRCWFAHGAFHFFLIHCDAFIVQRNLKRIDKTIRHGQCVAFVDGDASPVVRTNVPT